MGLFGPAWKSKNESKAIAAVKTITDDKELLNVVLNCPTGAWKTALDQIRDPAVILQAALQSPAPNIRLAAAGRITDPASVEILANREKDFSTRNALFGRLNECRVLAVRSMSDRTAIKQIALTDQSVNVPIEAVNKLTATADIIDVAAHARSDSVRKAAIDKLSGDQNSLYEVVINADKVSFYALDRITDPKYLELIALNSPHSGMRLDAVKRIKDQTTLIKIALEDDNFKVRCAAVDLIEDQSTLTKVALKDDELSETVSHAVARIEDSKVVEQALLKHPYLVYEKIVLEKIRDQKVLYDLVMNERSAPSEKRKAIESINDYYLIVKLTEDIKDYDFKNIAIDQKAKLEKNFGLCTKCGKQLTDEEINQCRCSCGAEAHDFEFSEEVTEYATDSYWSRDVYQVCRRCGKRQHYAFYEGWGTDVD